MPDGTKFWRCAGRTWNRSEKTLRIEPALEETKAGLAFKAPKTKRGIRTITIDDDLVGLLLEQRERHQRIMSGVPDGTKVDLSLVKLPGGSLIFPSPAALTRPRDPHAVTKGFIRRIRKLGFKLRFHDLRGTHETLLLDAGVPVHVVAARCGHDPAVLLRCYAKRTKKADTSAAAVIGALFRPQELTGSNLGPARPRGHGSFAPPKCQVLDLVGRSGRAPTSGPGLVDRGPGFRRRRKAWRCDRRAGSNDFTPKPSRSRTPACCAG